MKRRDAKAYVEQFQAMSLFGFFIFVVEGLRKKLSEAGKKVSISFKRRL